MLRVECDYNFLRDSLKLIKYSNPPNDYWIEANMYDIMSLLG